MQTCNNCGHEFIGKYCSDCGQKAGVNRLSMQGLSHELIHSFTHVEKGILRLIKEFFISPGKVYAGYFGGKRKTYFSPVMFFLLSMGLLIFLGDKLSDREMYVTNNDQVLVQKILYHYQKIRYLIFIPVIGCITWLFFYKRFNLAECLAFWFFCIGFVSVIEIISFLPQFIFVHHRHFIRVIVDWLAMFIIFIHMLLVFFNKTWFSAVKCFFLTAVSYFILVYILNYIAYLNGLGYTFDFLKIVKQIF